MVQNGKIIASEGLLFKMLCGRKTVLVRQTDVGRKSRSNNHGGNEMNEKGEPIVVHKASIFTHIHSSTTPLTIGDNNDENDNNTPFHNQMNQPQCPNRFNATGGGRFVAVANCATPKGVGRPYGFQPTRRLKNTPQRSMKAFWAAVRGNFGSRQ